MPLESNLQPGQRWAFDDEVTDHFDDMLERSVPDYDTMRRTVGALAARYATEGTFIVDLGCSAGGSLDDVIRHRGAHNRYLGVEVSEPMRDRARERFASWQGRVEIRDLDLRFDYPRVPASVTLAVLTLMFVPIEHRQQVVAEAYAHTVDGGALIVVEKVLGDTADLAGTFRDLHHKMKADNGYTQDEIDRKALSLEGVLVPVTAEWNGDMLRRAGFRAVDCFWRFLNFAGWVAIK